jgi:hypothetical protein
VEYYVIIIKISNTIFFIFVDISHIFLPPCRYIFHGAEIGRCDSPLPFEDDHDHDSNNDCSIEIEDVSCTEGELIEKEEGFKDNCEHNDTEEREFRSTSEMTQMITNADCFPTSEVKE